LIGAIYKASGTSTAFTNEAMTNSGDNKRYSITNTAKAYWDNTQAVTVKVNGVTVTTGFTIEYAGGNVVFTVSQGANPVTVSGSYLPVAQVGGGYNWKLDAENDMIECTDFQSGGWKTFVEGQSTFSGSLEKYWLDGTTFAEIGNDTLVLVLYVDGGANKLRYEGYAEFKKDGVETPYDGLIKTSVDFQGNGPFYYRAG
jgi:hypothetical protein